MKIALIDLPGFRFRMDSAAFKPRMQSLSVRTAMEGRSAVS
jgi:hypothetical protein